MKKTCIFFITAALGLIFILGGIPVLNAQETAADEFTLEEITVTAEKRTENLQKVAMSIEVIQGEDVRNTGRTSMEDILRDIPNVSTSDAGGSKTINIRGVGMDLPVGEGTGEASVSTNFDGTNQSRPEGQLFGFFDIDRVEVLRGPQGTLYGRNATAGAINIVSTKPTTDEVKGYTSLEVGTYNKMKAEAAINIPIADTFAARLATVSTEQDATTKDDEGFRNSMRGFASRLQLRYMPDDETSVNLLTSYYKTHGSYFAGFVSKENWDAGIYDVNGDQYPFDQLGKSTTESFKLALDVETPVGPGIVTFLPTYETLKTRNSRYGYVGLPPGMEPPPDAETAFSLGGRPWENEAKTVEFRYSNKNDSPIKWVGGLYYMETDEPQTPLYGDYIVGARGNFTPGDPQPLYWYKTSAAFGQTTVPFTNFFRLVLGARYSVDKKGYDDTRYEPSTYSGKFDYFDWKVGVENDFGEDVMGYLTVGSGHKPGGHNADTGSTFDPEEMISAEIGIKSRMMDNRFQLNGDIYYSSYKGYQTVDGWQTNPGEFPPDIIVVFFNADKARLYGAEMDATLLVGSGTSLRLAGSYHKSEYISDFFLHQNNELVNLKGDPMPHSPEFKVNFSAEHEFFLPDGSSLTPKVSYKWEDGQYVGVFTSDDTWSPAYDVVDVTIAYASPKNWSLNFYCNNALNENYYTGINGGGTDNVSYVVAAPLTAGMILNVRF